MGSGSTTHLPENSYSTHDSVAALLYGSIDMQALLEDKLRHVVRSLRTGAVILVSPRVQNIRALKVSQHPFEGCCFAQGSRRCDLLLEAQRCRQAGRRRGPHLEAFRLEHAEAQLSAAHGPFHLLNVQHCARLQAQKEALAASRLPEPVAGLGAALQALADV